MAVWSIISKAETVINKRIDCEFFHPNYIASEEKVKNTKKVMQLGDLGTFLIGPFGSAFSVSNYDRNSKYRYIRGKDVKPFVLAENDNVYLPKEDFIRLREPLKTQAIHGYL